MMNYSLFLFGVFLFQFAWHTLLSKESHTLSTRHGNIQTIDICKFLLLLAKESADDFIAFITNYVK